MEGDSTYFVIILGLIVGVILFLILRGLVRWYHKKNDRIKLQKRTNYLLERIFEQLGGKLEDDNNENN